MAKPNGGTNLFNGATVDVALKDNQGNGAFVRCTVANIPSATDGYAVGCLLQATDTGGIYTNIGTTSSCTFTLLEDAGGSFILPVTATDATTTTTTSMALTQNAVTTGAGLTQALNGLTTGFGHSITHTTSVIANGGSLLNLSSTGVDTTTTTGALLNLTSTASTAGTQVLITASGLTTGTAVQITNAAQTTGAALSITTAAATTGGGIVVTTPSSNAIALGRGGATNPAFQVDASTASSATGIKITAAAAAGGVAIAGISSGTNENLTIDAKGSGTITLNGTGTGNIVLGRATTGVSTSLTGGDTLKNATAVPATAGAVAAGVPISMYSTGITIEVTSNAPTHARAKGSICINTGGSSDSTRMYVNTDGGTTWTSFTTEA